MKHRRLADIHKEVLIAFVQNVIGRYYSKIKIFLSGQCVRVDLGFFLIIIFILFLRLFKVLDMPEEQ